MKLTKYIIIQQYNATPWGVIETVVDPLIDKLIHKMGSVPTYAYIMEYYSSLKKKVTLIHVTTWTTHENVSSMK
jgi:hypothetical protein